MNAIKLRFDYTASEQKQQVKNVIFIFFMFSSLAVKRTEMQAPKSRNAARGGISTLKC
jgi:hypothetical protein